MWVVTVLVTVEKLTPDGVEYVQRAFVSRYKAGRIPNRAQMVADAFAKAREFFQFIADTVGGTRPYEYGEPHAANVISVDFVR